MHGGSKKKNQGKQWFISLGDIYIQELLEII